MSTRLSVLMEATSDHLAALAVSLAEEIQQTSTGTQELSPDERLCKETLLSIGVLLPKLRTATWSRRASEVQAAARCIDCEEN